jgi:hypothetical protein
MHDGLNSFLFPPSLFYDLDFGWINTFVSLPPSAGNKENNAGFVVLWGNKLIHTPLRNRLAPIYRMMNAQGASCIVKEGVCSFSDVKRVVGFQFTTQLWFYCFGRIVDIDTVT